MNTGQSLLSIGALLILSILILRINNSILVTDEILVDSKVGILANSVAVSIIEKASRKFFDAATTEGPVDIETLTTDLGPRYDEIPPDSCNDFDDFHGYTQVDTFYNSLLFFTECEVCYVEPENPDVKVTGPTWHKKLSVKTYCKPMNDISTTPADTFKISTIYSYWTFN
jgi:MSHA pilin protein MshD